MPYKLQERKGMTFTYCTVRYPRPCRQLTYITTKLLMHHYGKAVGNQMRMLRCSTFKTI